MDGRKVVACVLHKCKEKIHNFQKGYPDMECPLLSAILSRFI